MKLKSKILVHLTYWIYMLNQQFYYFFIGKKYPNFWEDTLISYSLSIITFYVVYFSLTYLLRNKNRVLNAMLGVGLLLVLGIFRFYTYDLLWSSIFKLSPMEGMTGRDLVYYSARITLITSVYALLIRLAIDWFEAQKIKSEMKNQTQASELALLRYQVNPHFLFNTLNNIYSLVYKKSEDAPAAVMKLSAIMRYVLYDANTDLVPLDKEVEYLNSFIELQKLRTHQGDFVKFNVSGNIAGKNIAPMLLIPFVENAFKHGNKSAAKPGILIDLCVSDHLLTFEVKNHVKRNNTIQKDKVGGIGLQNIRRRLDLLYKDKYSLKIEEQNDIYSINLVLRNI